MIPARSHASRRGTLLNRIGKDFRANWSAYVLVLPVLAYFALFCYKPMYGAIIAFKDFSIRKGILDSPWTSMNGLRHFYDFFNSFYFGRVLRNTLAISVSSILFSFPAPIILALLLNEVRSSALKRTVQTISYMPHFISLVVVCSLIRIFTSHTGFIVKFMTLFGYDGNYDLLNNSSFFLPVYIISGIWQETGWGCIIYLSALAGIDMELYEAARIDGANRWKQTIHVTLPGIMGTVTLLLILRLGSLMSVGHEKIILLYHEGIYDTADVISTFVYRRGLVQGDWSFSTAVGLFNSVINIILVISSNWLSNRMTGMGIW